MKKAFHHLLMHISHDKPVLPSFALFTFLPFHNIQYFPLAFIRNKLRSGLMQGWRLHTSAWDKNAETRTFEMSGCRQTDRRDGTMQPLFLPWSLQLSALPDLLLLSSKSERRADGGKARRCPQGDGHAAFSTILSTCSFFHLMFLFNFL